MIYLNNFVKGLSCVAGGFLIQFCIGSFYTFGNMSPYMMSYLRVHTTDYWVNSGHMVWIFSVSVLFTALTMSLGGLLSQKIGARLTCLIGGWTMSTGTALTYFTIKQNLGCVILTYGLIFGIGIGISYSVSIATAVKWFPHRSGLVSGIVIAGFGLGSLLFTIVQTKFINPLNISANDTTSAEKYFTDHQLLNKVPMCFVVMGVCYAVIQLLGAILIIEKPTKDTRALPVALSNDVGKQLISNEEKVDENYSKTEAHIETANELVTQIPEEVHEFTTREAVMDKRFWILWATFFFNSFVIVAISSFYKSFGQTFMGNDNYFSTVGAVSALFNTGGRIVWGRLLDVMSYRKIMTGLTLMTTVIMGSFYAISYIPSGTGAEAMYFIWVCLLFFCIAGSFSIFPAVASQNFGNSNMAIIYGLIFSGYAVSSIIGSLVSSLLLRIIHYPGIFVGSAICALISLVLTQFFPIPTSKKPQKRSG